MSERLRCYTCAQVLKVGQGVFCKPDCESTAWSVLVARIAKAESYVNVLMVGEVSPPCAEIKALTERVAALESNQSQPAIDRLAKLERRFDEVMAVRQSRGARNDLACGKCDHSLSMHVNSGCYRSGCTCPEFAPQSGGQFLDALRVAAPSLTNAGFCQCSITKRGEGDPGKCYRCGLIIPAHGKPSPPAEAAKEAGTTVISDALVDAVRRWDSIHCAEDDGCCSSCARLHREITHFDMEPYDAPVTPAPTPEPAKEEGWVALGSLKPGDVFETREQQRGFHGGRGNGRDADRVWVGMEHWRGLLDASDSVRRLRVVAPGEIVVVADDEATVEAMTASIVDYSGSIARESAVLSDREARDVARRILAALKERAR